LIRDRLVWTKENFFFILETARSAAEIEVVELSGSDSSSDTGDGFSPSPDREVELDESAGESGAGEGIEQDGEMSSTKRPKLEYRRNPETENSQTAELNELLEKEPSEHGEADSAETQKGNWDCNDDDDDEFDIVSQLFAEW